MWDLFVSVPDHCSSFYYSQDVAHLSSGVLVVLRFKCFFFSFRVQSEIRLLKYLHKIAVNNQEGQSTALDDTNDYH